MVTPQRRLGQTAHIDIAALEGLAAQGMVSRIPHPRGHLLLWNYTRACQYAAHWTPTTVLCRGLVTDYDGQIVARPFPKFFNVDEYERVTGERIPDEPFTITEKLDGSLIIVFSHHGQLEVCTRGSWTSTQAIIAQHMLHETYPAFLDWIEPNWATYLFELIHPSNRIVVDYGQREELVLLAEIANETGEEFPLTAYDWPVPVVRSIPCPRGFRALPQYPNEEGYVIRFASGLRLKLKNPDYVRLHRLLTGTSAKSVWEAIRDGVPLDRFLTGVPDEFDRWVRGIHHRLASDYGAYVQGVAAIASQLDTTKSRRELAEEISQHPAELRPALFMALDGRDYRAYLWKLVKPSSTEPFQLEEESS